MNSEEFAAVLAFSNSQSRRPYVCVPLRGKRGGVALVSEVSLPLIDGCAWYQSVGGYVMSPKHGLMHRRVAAADSGEHVDHKNGDRLDNRRENLRCCTQELNNQHCRKRSLRWPYKGVRKFSNRWHARITIARKGIYLGSFDTAEEAARAYDVAASKAFGRMAILNFGESK